MRDINIAAIHGMVTFTALTNLTEALTSIDHPTENQSQRQYRIVEGKYESDFSNTKYSNIRALRKP